MRHYYILAVAAAAWVIFSLVPPSVFAADSNTTNPLPQYTPIVSNVTDTSAVISWYGAPRDIGIVYYGTSEGDLKYSRTDLSQRANGNIYITLTNLTPSTTYFYRAISTGEGGAASGGSDTVYKFKTADMHYENTRTLIGKVISTVSSSDIVDSIVYLEVAGQNDAAGRINGIMLSALIDSDSGLFTIPVGYVFNPDKGVGGNISFVDPFKVSVSVGVRGGMEKDGWVVTDTGGNQIFIGTFTVGPIQGIKDETEKVQPPPDFTGFIAAAALILVGMVAPMVMLRKTATEEEKSDKEGSSKKPKASALGGDKGSAAPKPAAKKKGAVKTLTKKKTIKKKQ